MTAIAVGRLPICNIIVADSIVQLDPCNSGQRNARVKDKIYDMQSSKQYVTLLGEELLMVALNIFDTWLLNKNKSLNLINEQHFLQFLLAADKHREIVKRHDKTPLPLQETSTMYVVSSDTIKEYQIFSENDKYKIKHQEFLNVNELVLNYKGNKKVIRYYPTNLNEIFEVAKQEILKEHEYRKSKGYLEGKTPLKYDFENKFTAVILPFQEEETISRIFSEKDFTDFYLTWWADWDFILNSKFKWSPDFDFPDKI